MNKIIVFNFLLIALFAFGEITHANDLSAIKIQRIYRGYKFRKKYKVLKAHQEYARSIGGESLSSFTLTSPDGLKSITYLSEYHFGKGPLASKLAKDVALALSETGELVFVESPERYDEFKRNESFAEHINRRGKMSPNPGIAVQLADVLPSHLLKELESGSAPESYKNFRQGAFARMVFMDCEEVSGLDIMKLIPTAKELAEGLESMQIAGSKRNFNQADTIDKFTPIGHSWAIGGDFHIAGVKQILKENGWH